MEVKPLHTIVTNVLSDSGEETAIVTRLWTCQNCDRCDRCPECTAVSVDVPLGNHGVIGLCTVTVPHHVGQGQGSFLRLDGLELDELPLPGS